MKFAFQSKSLSSIRMLVVRAYEAAASPLYGLGERKDRVIDIWLQVLETVKQAQELNNFELIFIT